MNTTTKTLIGVLGLLVLVSGWGQAAGVGTTGAQFLKIGPGARAVAMGSAFSAVADDLYAIYWNPAGLALQKERQATASYVQYFQGVSIGFLGYSQEVFGRGTLGVGVNYLSVGGLERRTLDVDAAEGTFGANDMAVSLSYAEEKLLARYVPGLAVGANVKFIKQSLDTQSAQTYALDLAGYYRTPVKALTASLGIYNIGNAVKFINEADPLPLDVRLGAAYRMCNDALVVALDVDDYTVDERITEQLGLEYTLHKMLSVRAGYKAGIDADKLGGLTGFTAGVGINVWNIQLDYAFVPYGELNDTHRIGISTKF